MGTRFSFDIGTNSIGWSVWRTGPDPGEVFGKDAPLALLGGGVRLFKDGRNPKDGQSLAAMRRLPKQARRRRDRFVLRRGELINALVKAQLMPRDVRERQMLQLLDPYRLRAQALHERLDPFAVGRALFHLNQRRGFQSNRKTDKADKDKGKIAEGEKRLKEQLAVLNCRTLGEFLWLRHRGETHDSNRPRSPGRQSTRIRLDGEGSKALYAFYPTRQMVRDEFEAIWKKQADYHPDLLTDAARERIGGILFRQRPLKKPKIGRCTFVHEEERLPKALPSVQAREIYERLNHLRLSTGPDSERRLRPDERDLLAAHLLNEDKLTFIKLRKALKLGGEVKISLEESGEKELPGLKVSRMLQKPDHFGPRWRTLSWHEKDALVLCLLEEPDEQRLISWLMDKHGLSREAAENCASIPLPEGYSRLGPTANAAILEALLKERDALGFVVPYSEAVLRAGAALDLDWHHSDIDIRSGMPAPELPKRMPYYAEVLQRHVLPGSMAPEDKDDDAAFWGRLPNPSVHIGLNQLRRLVDKLIAEFGHPDQIVVELARDLKLNVEQKKREQDRNRENRAENDKRAAKLAELGILDDGRARARLKLFEEQQKANNGVALCPFSGRPIGIEKLFSPDIEIEHILPWSRTMDDSPANKVLCYRDMNRIKRRLSPAEAFSNKPEWPDIAARAMTLPPNKRWRFGPDAMDRFEKAAFGGMSVRERTEMGLESGFLARQLNETKYLSRLARRYLNTICVRFDAKTGERVYGDVYVTTGTLTGLLRGKWGLNSLLSDDNRKDRTDHRHHALDAIVIGAMTRGLLNHLAYESGRAEGDAFDAILKKIPWPFPQFRDVVRAKLDAMIVSPKAEHGKLGALHEDTAYGLIRDPLEAAEIGNLVRRKPFVDLTPGEIDAIRDAALRKAVQATVAGLRDAKGKVSDAKALRAALEAFAREHGIRHIRVAKEDRSAVTIADRRTGAPYKAVAPGENHHIDVVQMRDGSWKGFAATVFEVNRKNFRPQWEREKLGGKLVMRLHKGDTVELEETSGGRVVKVVQQLWMKQNLIVLAEHKEGGDLRQRHQTDNELDPFRWDFANIGKLKERGCVAVAVDEIGRVRRKRSNAA